ncbi:peptidylprolyl isomerase [Rhodococcus triatomae]|uniref:Peptidyl-prolyl cis-trans isomerase B (Cyclophilin B) n=1 Tax=Rhodococcus triatomae TaxID=300028 RepID=A0A1G8KJP7_9NOCA|nr:peptidylprolyl isomerase [Rhodococcus triatomae]QNG18947.1 peptidylprolyl isomerase [Rhodococcus triatomae]QNG25139.1 peptidylprolyl isomerase [Rhodococcus triatomae]SDI43671.1 peptidyl-prolyl cis-trans isomerase B (cyclophilin B) [Rhodococcus triatomae]
MPSNEQRREAAKRKLERQLARRAERARRRKQLTIGGTVVGVVVAVAAVAVVVTLTRGGDDSADEAATDTAAETQTPDALPAGRSEPLPELVSCTYTPDGSEPSRPVEPPRTDGIDTTLESVSVSMETSQGNVGLVLDNANSPCTVNNFLSLAGQGYFDDTPCHRLVTGAGLRVLQCGDPSGTGAGGPGYGFDNEFPTDQYSPTDPALAQPAIYPRGTLAMANTGAPGSNGSQFFMVYEDSQLPPNYTVFGSIDETGLATLDTIAAAGDDSSNQPGDGKPNVPVDITSVRMD